MFVSCIIVESFMWLAAMYNLRFHPSQMKMKRFHDLNYFGVGFFYYII